MKTVIEIDDRIVDLTLQDLLEMEEPINKNNLKISNIYSTIAYELSKRASEEISSLLGNLKTYRENNYEIKRLY